MGAEKALKGGITEAQINSWQAKYGADKVVLMSVPVDDTKKVYAHGYFRKPDLKIISAASKFMTDDPLKGAEILFENCFLGGDSLFKDDDEIKMSAMTGLSSLFKVRTAEIKNL